MSADTMDVKELTNMLWSAGVKKVTDNGVAVDLENNCFVSCDKLTPLTCTSNQQQENTMYHEDYEMSDNRTETERKADYFQSELRNAQSRKSSELHESYKLDLQSEPNDPKEMIEWIKDGKFTFAKNRLNDDGSWREPNDYHPRPYGFLNYIQWNNPDRDTAGFDAADKKLDDATRSTERTITAASTGAEMLKALQDFESTTLN